MIKAREKVKKVKEKKKSGLTTCADCGGEDIEIKVWYNPNSKKVNDQIEGEAAWCMYCDDEVETNFN